MKSEIKNRKNGGSISCGITNTNIKRIIWYKFLLRYFVGIMTNSHKIISVKGAPSS